MRTKDNEQRFGYLFKVPNDEEGKYFIHLARKYLNRGNYKMRLRGSNCNPKKMKEKVNMFGEKTTIKQQIRHRHNVGAIPLDIANYVRLYFNNEFQDEQLRQAFQDKYIAQKDLDKIKEILIGCK